MKEGLVNLMVDTAPMPDVVHKLYGSRGVHGADISIQISALDGV